MRNNCTRPKVRIICNIIHNFSSCHSTSEEDYTLSFNLDQHIPAKVNENIPKNHS